MLLRSHSFGGFGSTRSDGILPLSVLPLVVWRTRECFYALETGGRAGHQRQEPASYISEDRNQPATILPQVRRTSYDHASDARTGRCILSDPTRFEVQSRCACQLRGDCIADARRASQAEGLP